MSAMLDESSSIPESAGVVTVTGSGPSQPVKIKDTSQRTFSITLALFVDLDRIVTTPLSFQTLLPAVDHDQFGSQTSV